MVPRVGIEPTTLSSSGLRSTTELPRHKLIQTCHTLCSLQKYGTHQAIFVNLYIYYSTTIFTSLQQHNLFDTLESTID
jgi:hypothetical protein